MIISSEYAKQSSSYQQLPLMELRERIKFVYYMLEVAIHYGDRMHLLTFIPNMARARYMEKFDLSEIILFVRYIGEHISGRLLTVPGLTLIQQRIENEAAITVQIIIDEIEDVYDRLKKDHPCNECRDAGIRLCSHDAALAILTRTRN